MYYQSEAICPSGQWAFRQASFRSRHLPRRSAAGRQPTGGRRLEVAIDEFAEVIMGGHCRMGIGAPP
jgi:hypothetical protein